MKQVYNAKYYSLELITQERMDYITLGVKWLTDLLGLKDSHWPIDCMKILDLLKDMQFIPFAYKFIDMSDDCDGAARYFPEHDVYMILINKNKVKYPYKSSQDRRLNFTIAHELGHIALGHVLNTAKKTQEEKDYENIEADEFAARFLMPQKLIFSCNFYSLSSAAEYLMVSETALWKRLNNMKRLDLLHSRRVSTCESCGNTKFSIFSEYCGICGQPLRGKLKGIHRIHYTTDIQTDGFKRVVECPICKFKHVNADKCSRCGTYIFNYCSEYLISGDDNCGFANPSNSRYCEMCGKPTYFYNRGLLSSWKEDINGRETYITATI
jgi:Zn-dependent peptidase ImmA (M78 family)